jgi:hypothetical protein
VLESNVKKARVHTLLFSLLPKYFTVTIENPGNACATKRMHLDEKLLFKLLVAGAEMSVVVKAAMGLSAGAAEITSRFR